MDIHEFATAAKQRILEDWDVVIAITGREGVGKTTLALEIAFAIDPTFSLDANILFNPETDDLVKKIFSLPPGSVILVDEAIKTSYKRRFATETNIVLNQIYTLCRKQKKISIFCMPRFFDFDEFFRNHRIRFWIHVFERGKAAIFIIDDENPFSSDPWHVKENFKRINRRRRSFWEPSSQVSLEQSFSSVRNFYASLVFPPLPVEVMDAYRERVEKTSADILSQLKKKKSREKSREVSEEAASVAQFADQVASD